MKFTSQDLAKAMGLKVGDRVEFKFSLDKKYSAIVEEYNGKIVVSIKPDALKYDLNLLVGSEFYTILPPKPILTEDEKVILRNLPKEYKWIARDKGYKELFVFTEKPERYGLRSEDKEIWDSNSNIGLCVFHHLFPFIKWEDEPYEISELLK